MWSFRYDSIGEITKLLGTQSLAMTKKFGQNFLLSQSVRERIVDQLAIGKGDTVWEIGPGIGALTSILLSRGATVRAFEIDHGFCRILREEAFGDEPKFSLIEGDALKTLPLQKDLPSAICGNLPYNVGSVCIARLIESSMLPQCMVFTLQKEVVERMCAHVGDDEYSSFSLLTQLDYENRLAFTIGRNNFYPVPNVDSAVVVMKKRKESLVDDANRSLFLETVRQLFSQRRKTIRNNLSLLGKERLNIIFERAGLTGSERAEVLTMDQLKALVGVIKEN